MASNHGQLNEVLRSIVASNRKSRNEFLGYGQELQGLLVENGDINEFLRELEERNSEALQDARKDSKPDRTDGGEELAGNEPGPTEEP